MLPRMDVKYLTRDWARATAKPGLDVWRHLPDAERRELIARVPPLIDGPPPDAEFTLVRKRDLSFYPDHQLCEFSDPTVMPPGGRRYAVIGADRTVMVDWTNGPVYKLNAEVPIRLSGNSVRDYVRFFFRYIRGRHGFFHLIERLDDIPFAEEPNEGKCMVLVHCLHPLILTETTDGSYRLHASILFKDRLFSSRVSVAVDGVVSMDNEEVMVDTVGARQDADS